MAKKRSAPAHASARARTPGPSPAPGPRPPRARGREATPAGDCDSPTPDSTAHADLDPSGRHHSDDSSARPCQWTYVVRNRRRWSGRDSLVQEQSIRAQADLRDEFRPDQDRPHRPGGRAGAQVIIPYDNEEERAGDARGSRGIRDQLRHASVPAGEPLTVLRQLVRSRKSDLAGDRRAQVGALRRKRAPEPSATSTASTPERTLVQTSLGTAVAWHEIKNPTRKEPRRRGKAIHPDIHPPGRL